MILELRFERYIIIERTAQNTVGSPVVHGFSSWFDEVVLRVVRGSKCSARFGDDTVDVVKLSFLSLKFSTCTPSLNQTASDTGWLIGRLKLSSALMRFLMRPV